MLPWIIVGLPAAVGLTLSVASLRGRGEWAAGWLGVGTASVTLLLSAWAAVARPTSSFRWFGDVRISLVVDGLAIAMVLTLCVVSLAVMMLARRELPAGDGRARCVGWLLVLYAASLAASMATSLLVLLMAWEVMALSIWALMGFSRRDPGPVRSGANAYLFLRAGDLGLYLAAVAAFASVGTFEIADAAAEMEGTWTHLAAAGLILSALIKSAQFPFAIWFGQVFEQRRHIGAALAATLMVIAGGYLLARCYPIVAAAGWALPSVAWIGVVGAALMGAVALTQRDLQQALAASSASQKGFILLAIGVGTIPGAVGYIAAHAVFKGLLFLGAAVYLRRTESSDLRTVPAMRTVAPAGALLFSLGALALAGVPPLSGWVVKDEVLAAALAASPALYMVGLLAAIVTALYASRLLWLVWGLPEPGPSTVARSTAGGGTFLGAMALLAGLTIAASLLLLPPVRSRWQDLVGGPSGPAAQPWELALTGAVALGALLLTRHWHRQGRLEFVHLPLVPRNALEWSRRWFGLAGLVDRTRGGVLAVSRVLVRFDERGLDALVEAGGQWGRRASRQAAARADTAIDGLIDGLAACTGQFARWTAARDDTAVDGLVDGLAARIGLIGRWARRPQTGLLHQYFAQAAVVVAFLVLLFGLAR